MVYAKLHMLSYCAPSITSLRHKNIATEHFTQWLIN